MTIDEFFDNTQLSLKLVNIEPDCGQGTGRNPNGECIDDDYEADLVEPEPPGIGN